MMQHQGNKERNVLPTNTEAELSHHVKILRIIPCTTICNHEEKFEPLGISEIWSTSGEQS